MADAADAEHRRFVITQAVDPINPLWLKAYQAGLNDPLGDSDYDGFTKSLKSPMDKVSAGLLKDYYYGGAILQAMNDFDVAAKDPQAKQSVLKEGRKIFEDRYKQWNNDQVLGRVRPLVATYPLIPYDQKRKDAYWNKYHDEIAWRMVNPFD